MKKNNTRAFTLVETLVAVAILMLAILGPFSIIASSLKNAFSARDQMTAYYLAQEGIDYIRLVRDNVALNTAYTWDDFSTSMIGACGGNGYPCDIDNILSNLNGTDLTNITFPSFVCSVVQCEVLYIDPNGNYSHSKDYPNVVTPFSRTITVTSDDKTKEITIKVKMQWKSNNVDKTFTLSEQLFNIY